MIIITTASASISTTSTSTVASPSPLSSSILPAEDSIYGIEGKNPILKTLPKYEIPEQREDKIATLNQTGFMKTELDIFTEEFIKYSSNSTRYPVLEIGAAYGAATLPALRNNARVIANDIDEKHLAILYSKVYKNDLNKLYLKPGCFPDQLDFPENSLNAVLICRVAHFLKGAEIEEGFKKIYKWLIPGGKVFFVSLSPYHHLLRVRFLPIYLARLEAGEEWPGVIDNMKDYNPTESADIPNFLHVFEEKVMEKVLIKQGFKIEKITKFDYSNNSSDNEGYLGFIAVKPF